MLAFGQSDLKRLLAYSTISQIAIMLSALAAAPPQPGPDAGLLHLLSHAMFKALLFLAMGWASLRWAAPPRWPCAAAPGCTPASRVRSASACWPSPGCRRWPGSSPRSTSSPRPRTAPTRPPPGVVVLVALFAHRGADGGVLHARLLMLTAHVEARRRPARRSPPVVQGVRAVLVGLERARRARPADRRLPGRRDLDSVWVALTVLALVVGRRAVGPARRLRPRPGRGARPRRPVPARVDSGLGVDGVYQRLVARPVTALARLVVVLDRDVIDAYVRGTVVATRAAGGRAAAPRGERPSGRSGVLCGVLALGVVGVAGVAALLPCSCRPSPAPWSSPADAARVAP